jgi:acyl carrier protein
MFNLVIKIIQEFVEIDEDSITEDTNLINDLHLTSYDIVGIIGKIESDLGIEIPDREIRNLDTVGELIKYLNNKLL